MTARVNEDCIGCGMCVEVCPEVFEMGADGFSHVIGDADACADRAYQASEVCPVNAISVE